MNVSLQQREHSLFKGFGKENEKTFATSMPNHIGAFLKASRCFSQLGINITRVSYDKSIDSHMLFLNVDGTKEQLKKVETELEKIGYLQNNQSSSVFI